ncbi:LysR family transcriptional regulator [Aureimonas altamirensis]|uniref:LysR family transcriptional regulator n=1 Tax=Aureimonas altamirensis TaxID=370622 RepID=UPI002036CD62|nr:LysR family transcriptional regulator [Aureimonas altamirensis]MCM2503152.1 LysR family transcriptional regulator [Aureimonas altamirensis]
MNERDLRYFLAIVDCRGVGAAADRLGVTQPAVTKCVDRLEDLLRTPLLARKGRYVELTPAGMLFHRRAKAILLRMEDAMQELSSHASGLSGHVRLGAAATMTEALLPGVIDKIMRETPGITIELTTGMNDVLREALRENRLDLLVSPTVDGGEEFESEPLISDKVVVVARQGHPLADALAPMPEMLRYEWILPPSTVALRRWLDHSFERAGLPHPRVQVEVNSLVLMPRLIGNTDLISFASSQKLGGTNLIEIACPETTHDRSFGLLYRRDAYRSPAVDTVADFLRRVTAS